MWEQLLAKYKEKFGASSMDRVTKMLNETPQARRSRHPLQKGADYLLPNLGPPLLDIDKYPEIARARAHFAAKHVQIKDEITQYLEKHGRPEAHGGGGGDKWRVVFLSRVGRETEGIAGHFPESMDHIKRCRDIIYPVAGISFSVLEAGAIITPHSDRTNVFIHFHQGVTVPSGCGIKVAGKQVDFEETKSFLFDPSYEHEAWNRSQQIRVQLILPLWHPETTAAEREALVEVFEQLRQLMGH